MITEADNYPLLRRARQQVKACLYRLRQLHERLIVRYSGSPDTVRTTLEYRVAAFAQYRLCRPRRHRPQPLRMIFNSTFYCFASRNILRGVFRPEQALSRFNPARFAPYTRPLESSCGIKERQPCHDCVQHPHGYSGFYNRMLPPQHPQPDRAPQSE